jgi:hypothetical protein
MLDPNGNGSRTLDLLHDHAATDDLIGWAWHPGAGRNPPHLRGQLAADQLRHEASRTRFRRRGRQHCQKRRRRCRRTFRGAESGSAIGLSIWLRKPAFYAARAFSQRASGGGVLGVDRTPTHESTNFQAEARSARRTRLRRGDGGWSTSAKPQNCGFAARSSPALSQ